MSWTSTMNDLASSWKVGIVFIALVALRYVLTSQGAVLTGAREVLLTGIAGLFGSGKRSDEPSGKGEGEEEGQPHNPKEEARRSVLEFVDSGLIALVLVFMIIRPFFIQAFYIPSASMHPTLLENDKILVNKLVYRLHQPQRGDVIVFRSPPAASEDQKDFIKRLIGLPGDTIEIRRGEVNGQPAGVLYRNGQRVDEPFIAEPMDLERPGLYGPVTVQPGKVLVMGDNRNNSNDGRFWGQLDMGRIRGKAMVIFWPLSRIRLIR